MANGMLESIEEILKETDEIKAKLPPKITSQHHFLLQSALFFGPSSPAP